MTVHLPLLKDVPVGKGRYSYQTHASLVGMVYTAVVHGLESYTERKTGL